MKRRALLAGSAAAAASTVFSPYAIAAPGTTVTIGYLDSMSGVLSDIGGYHAAGVHLAIAEANARGRVRYAIAAGDDNSKPQVGINETHRLVDQEKVDVLMMGTSSAVALAITPITLQAGVFTLLIGPQDTSLSAERATATAYRFAQDCAMLVKPLTQRILAGGKRWYFIVEDFAFGRDAYARLSALLRRAGGTEVGADVLPVGTSDFSSTLTKIRNTETEQVVLCQGGLDVAIAARQFVIYGLHKKMRLAGMTLEDFYYKTLPLGVRVVMDALGLTKRDAPGSRPPPQARRLRLESHLSRVSLDAAAHRAPERRRYDQSRETGRRVRRPSLRFVSREPIGVARLRSSMRTRHLRRGGGERGPVSPHRVSLRCRRGARRRRRGGSLRQRRSGRGGARDLRSEDRGSRIPFGVTAPSALRRG